MGRKALFYTFTASVQQELVDSFWLNLEQLPEPTVLFEQACATERMLEQRAKIVHHAREVDRQQPPRAAVMATLADYSPSPLLSVPAPRYAPTSVAKECQTPPPAQVFAMWEEHNTQQPPPQRSPPPTTYEPPSSALDVRTSVDVMPLFFTQDGTAVQTSAHEISDPRYWTLDEPQMIFHGTCNPQDFSVMATYTQTA